MIKDFIKKYITGLKLHHFLLGSIATFIILLVLCIVTLVPRIEQKLLQQSYDSLKSQGDNFVGVKVSFSGRDAYLTGVVASEELNKLGQELVSKVNGVRVVNSDLQISQDCYLPTLEISRALQAELKELAKQATQIGFDAGMVNPTTELINYLSDIVELLNNYPPIPIVIVSYTDSVLSENDSLVLGKARAQLVYDFLIKKGLRAKCLSIKSEKHTLENSLESKKHPIKFLVKESK